MNRNLPNSLEAEQALIGSMLIYPSVVKIVNENNLLEEQLYSEAHKIIFKAMNDITSTNQVLDTTVLITKLNETNKLNAIGGMDYIVNLANTSASSANAIDYINLIKDRALKRELIQTAELIAKEGFDGNLDLDTLMDSAEKNILTVTRNRRGSEFRTSKEVVNNVIEHLNILKNNDQSITGVKVGFTDLDACTNGFQRGDLIILAARPAMGKTAFALNVAMNAAFHNEGAIALFSLEMSAESLMNRILSAHSEVKAYKFRDGSFNDNEFASVYESAEELSHAKLFIDDSPNMRISEIISKCRKLKTENGLDLVVVDYLQLVNGSANKPFEARRLEVAEVSRGLKSLARELDCPVIALAQLSRNVESRTDDKRPKLSDLAESGSIEQDADIVMFLYRELYYDRELLKERNPNDPEKSELIIAKHRNGQTKTVELSFNPNISKFYNYSTDI